MLTRANLFHREFLELLKGQEVAQVKDVWVRSQTYRVTVTAGHASLRCLQKRCRFRFYFLLGNGEDDGMKKEPTERNEIHWWHSYPIH